MARMYQDPRQPLSPHQRGVASLMDSESSSIDLTNIKPATMLLRSTSWPWKLVKQGRGRELPQGAMQVAIIEEDPVRTDKSKRVKKQQIAHEMEQQ